MDLIVKGFKGSDGNQYAFGNGGKIYKKSSGSWSVVYTDPSGNISGAAEFTHNDGSNNYIPYLVWATQTQLKKVKLSDTSFSNIVVVGS